MAGGAAAPDDLEGYTRLKGETGITLAAGEHWYTRWNVKPFLDRGIVSFVQSDPEWCGGISEWLKICELAGKISGGAGDSARASSPGRFDMRGVAERGALSDDRVSDYRLGGSQQRYQTRPLVPEAGILAMAEEPGLGPSLDESRLERV